MLFLEYVLDELGYLANLRHLYITKCIRLKYMPLNLSQLKNLYTLTEFRIDDAKVRGIEELQHMN